MMLGIPTPIERNFPRRQGVGMVAEERAFACRYCGKEVRTTDKRKMFCNKQCADRSRNGPALPVIGDRTIIRDLKDFRKLEEPGKQAVLLGQAGFSVAMFDIEATHLKPNVGRILCCSFKPIGQPVYTYQALAKGFRKPDVYDDGALAIAIKDELEKYDIIVGWNSKNFDVKFINSRVLHAGGKAKRAQYHIDGMWSWRTKLNAWSGLDTVDRFLAPDSEKRKTSVEWEKWMRAIGWDKKLSKLAMDDIVYHCERDVEVLEDVYIKIVNAGMVRSIRRDGGIL